MLVIDKESAIIGISCSPGHAFRWHTDIGADLPGEHVQDIEADHRHICKFDSPNNPNYLILRRCLLTTL